MGFITAEHLSGLQDQPYGPDRGQQNELLESESDTSKSTERATVGASNLPQPQSENQHQARTLEQLWSDVFHCASGFKANTWQHAIISINAMKVYNRSPRCNWCSCGVLLHHLKPKQAQSRLLEMDISRSLHRNFFWRLSGSRLGEDWWFLSPALQVKAILTSRTQQEEALLFRYSTKLRKSCTRTLPRFSFTSKDIRAVFMEPMSNFLGGREWADGNAFWGLNLDACRLTCSGHLQIQEAAEGFSLNCLGWDIITVRKLLHKHMELPR